MLITGLTPLAAALPPGAGEQQPELPTGVQASEDIEDPAVVSLSQEGLSVEQARAQMKTQVAAGVAESKLPEDLKSAYGGRQIFHDRGGLVVVSVTDPSKTEAISEHFARYGADNTEITSAEYTSTEVEQMVEDLQIRVLESRADDNARQIEVIYDELGTITVKVAPGELNSAESDILRSARDKPNIYKVVEVERIEQANSSHAT